MAEGMNFLSVSAHYERLKLLEILSVLNMLKNFLSEDLQFTSCMIFFTFTKEVMYLGVFVCLSVLVINSN